MLNKKHGIAHLFAAMGYTFDGLKVLAKETAFRHEVFLLITIQSIFFLFRVNYHYCILAFILWCLLIATEALNTAIELIVDKISPEISEFAKNTKDIASFAVFCVLSTNCMFAIYAILKTIIT